MKEEILKALALATASVLVWCVAYFLLSGISILLNIGSEYNIYGATLFTITAVIKSFIQTF